jgi:hypothetical protein
LNLPALFLLLSALLANATPFNEILSGPLEAQLQPVLTAYSPRIWWHPRERYEAMDPMTFLARSSLWFRARIGGPVRLRDRGAVRPADMLTIQDEPDRAFLKYEETELREPAATNGPPVFWRLSESQVVEKFPARLPGRKRVLVEYWYHSAFSDAGFLGIGDHQGDWEGMAVLVELEATPTGFKHEPIAAYYAAHEGGRWHCASQLEWTDDGHPVAYSALGSHATYARAGKNRRFLVMSDETAAGRKWDTWKRMRPLVREPYFGFRGAWGDIAWLPFMSGPKVPDARFKFLPKGSLKTETEALEELKSSGCDRL